MEPCVTGLLDDQNFLFQIIGVGYVGHCANNFFLQTCVTVRTLELRALDIFCTFLFDNYEIKALLIMYILSIFKV